MPPAKKKKAFKHWTPDEVKILNDSVKSARTAAAGIEAAAKKIGKRPETVRAKYYSMQKAKKKQRRTLTASPTRRSTTGTMTKGIYGMDSVALATLITEATRELQRRAVSADKIRQLIG